MKSLFETLAALSAGAALLSGCGGAPSPVNAAEVPAATEVKPSTQGGTQATESKTSGATAGATGTAAPAAQPTPVAMGEAPRPPAATTTPAAPVVANAAAVKPAGKPEGTAAPAAGQPAAKPKKTGAKKTDANGSCGAGTCA